MVYGQKHFTRTLPKELQKVGRALCRGRNESLASVLLEDPLLKKDITAVILDQVSRECDKICGDNSSGFVSNDPESLKKWSYAEQYHEMQLMCPTLLSILESATTLSKGPNPTLLTVAGTIFYCRTNRANSHASLISLILRKSGAKKIAFKRLNAIKICTSYESAIRFHTHLGDAFDQPVKSWQSTVLTHANSNAGNSLLESTKDILRQHLMKKSTPKPPVGYKLVGDNVDFKVKARHQTLSHQNQDYHMFNTIAVLDRIQNIHPIIDDAIFNDFSTVSYSRFLPNVQENRLFRDEVIILFGHIVVKYCTQLSWMKQYLPKYIEHPYMNYTKHKSVVVSIIQCNIYCQWHDANDARLI